MTILVTGGAGFIGSNFIIDWLEKLSEPVINIDLLTYAGNLDNLKSLENDPNHHFVHGDICNQELISHLLNKYKPRAVIHFAAESHVDRSINGPKSFIQTNILGTFHLLEAAKEYWMNLIPTDKENFRFLHISTDEVYGSLEPNEPPFTENNCYKPNSPYSASKASADHLVRAYHHTYNMPTLTTNCSNNYGPFQFTEKLIPMIIQNALTGKTIPIYGNGLQIRDWLYVGDHCAAIRRVLEAGQPGETYNIGGLNEKTNIEIVRYLCKIMDEIRPKKNGESYCSQMTFVKDRAGHDQRYAINATKIQNELNWHPTMTFETGMDQTIKWYLANQAWVNKILDKETEN